MRIKKRVSRGKGLGVLFPSLEQGMVERVSGRTSEYDEGDSH